MISGNNIIPDSSIISHTGLVIGSYYDNENVNHAIKNAYNTGFFQEIKSSYDAKNKTLVITVVEKSLINQVVFEKNTHLSKKDLLKVIESKDGTLLSETKLKQDVNLVTELYKSRGFYTVKVEPQIIKLDRSRVNLIYKIREGNKAKIIKISFIGNNKINNPDHHLRKILDSKETAWYRLLSSSDFLNQAVLENDRKTIESYYHNKGYTNAVVNGITTELSTDKKGFLVTFNIYEGKRFVFGTTTVTDLTKKFNIEEIKKNIDHIEGKEFSIYTLEQNKQKIINEIAKTKYLNSNVTYDFIERQVQSSNQNNKIDPIMDITFKIYEEKQSHINRINIINNTRTLDKVIRRQLALAEGDAYDKNKVEKSRYNLLNLGYFDTVEISETESRLDKNCNSLNSITQRNNTNDDELLDCSNYFKEDHIYFNDKVDLDIKVSEHKTGAAKIATSYSTSDGIALIFEAWERNILGTGKVVDISLQKSKKVLESIIGLTNPRFLDLDIEAGISVRISKEQPQAVGSKVNPNNTVPPQPNVIREDDEHKLNKKEIYLHLGYYPALSLQHIVRYNVGMIDRRIGTNISPIIQAQPERSTISAIGQDFIYSKLDNAFRPSKGYKIKLSQHLAGLLGGNTKYLKHTIHASLYKPIYKDKLIFNLKAQGGIISNTTNVPVNVDDGFFVGMDDICGFEPNGIGPRDKVTHDALGAKKYYATTAQISFPLGLNIDLHGIIFHDIASSFDIDLPLSNNVLSDTYYNSKSPRASYGAGIIWYSALGIVRADFGKAYSYRSYDKRESFRLTFGNQTFFW